LEKRKKIWFALILLLFLNGCSFSIRIPGISKEKYVERGLASWYGPGYYGQKTASGEIFTGKDLTAAHRTLPFNTRVKVTRLDNSKSVIVRINDRGPFQKGYIIDLSPAAAKKIGLTKSAMVEIMVIK